MAISDKRSPRPASVSSASFTGRVMLLFASFVLVASVLLIAHPSDANRQFKRVFCNFDGCHSKRAVNPRFSLAALVARVLRPDGERYQPEPEAASKFSASFDDYEGFRSPYPSIKKTSGLVDGPEATYKEPEMERLVQEILPAASNQG